MCRRAQSLHATHCERALLPEEEDMMLPHAASFRVAAGGQSSGCFRAMLRHAGVGSRRGAFLRVCGTLVTKRAVTWHAGAGGRRGRRCWPRCADGSAGGRSWSGA